jgi:DNA-binding MarR family transcriptional regulator
MNTTEVERDNPPVGSETASRPELLRALTGAFRALLWQGNKQGAVIMERIGLTLPQAAVMWTLSAYGGRATMSEIAHLTYQSGGTVTGIIDRLADAGLVERERDEADRRVVYVRTTPAGAAKLDEIEAARRRQMAQMTRALTDDELGQLHRIMEKLVAAE